MVIVCTAIVDPDKVHYETNPLKKEPPFKDYDFTFRQVTTEASYWHLVSDRVDTKLAVKLGKGSGDFVNVEWYDIRNSKLPPDVKVVAAHQFNSKIWSRQITDTSYSDYVKVDYKLVQRAMRGDQYALSDLPASIRNDVVPVKRIKVDGKVQDAMVLQKVPPILPSLAKSASISGIVHLAAIIAEDGTILELHSLGGPVLVIEAAMDAVKKWVYRPTLVDGVPVQVETTIDVTFPWDQ
jgi:hypothetical protein